MVAIVLQHGYSYLIVNILYQAASTAKNICNYTIRNHGQVPFEAVKCYILHNSCYSRHVYVYVAGLFGYSVISNHSLLQGLMITDISLGISYRRHQHEQRNSLCGYLIKSHSYFIMKDSWLRRNLSEQIALKIILRQNNINKDIQILSTKCQQ